MQKYIGRPRNYAIESVYCLQMWSDKRKITKSKIPLVKRKKIYKQKISLEYADYDDSGLRYIEGNCSTYFFNFHRWHYIDIFIFAGQGLFSIPPVNLIDAAHRNGVKILGSIMAPVNQPQYTAEFSLLFKKDINDTSVFPLGDKLIEVTSHYGFDGWFLNIEEPLPPDIDKQIVIEFMIYIRKKLKKNSIDAEIHWYDSNYVDGTASYDNSLNKNNSCLFGSESNRVSDGFFLNYNWNDNLLNLSRKTAESLSRDSYDVYAGIYFPVSHGSMCSLMKTCRSQYTSIGIWNINTKEMANNKEEYEKIENNFWTSLKDVAVLKEQPIVIPFGSNFSVGCGDSFWIDGKKMCNESYGQIASCDALSEYILFNPNIDISKNKVYEGGNSLFILTKSGNRIKLFNTYLDLNKKYEFVFVLDSNIVLELNLDEYCFEPKKYVYNNWFKYVFDVESLNSITDISITAYSNVVFSDMEFYLGQMTITETEHKNTNQVTNLVINDINWLYDDQHNIVPHFYLEWDDIKNRCFDIFYKRPDFSRFMFFKRAYRNSIFIDNIIIKGDIKTANNKIVFKVVAVDNSFIKSDSSSAPFIEFVWDPPLNNSSKTYVLDKN